MGRHDYDLAWPLRRREGEALAGALTVYDDPADPLLHYDESPLAGH